MLKRIFVFVIAVLVFNPSEAQKAFGSGNKIVMEHGVVSAYCAYSKGKSYIIISPAKNTDDGTTENYIDEYDNKATKIGSRKVKLLNEFNKNHTLHSVVRFQDKLFMINSFYDKTDKKLSIYGGYLSDVDGEPEGGLGREIVGIETKKPEEFIGLAKAYSPDSTKIAFFLFRNYTLEKNDQLDVHVCVVDALTSQMDQPRIFSITIPKNNNIKVSPAVGNDGLIFLTTCNSYMNAQKKIAQTIKIYSKDNSDQTQVADVNMNNMKAISHLITQVQPNNLVMIAGYFSYKPTLTSVDGVFNYVFDPSQNNFRSSNVFDFDQPNTENLKGNAKDPKDKSIHTFAHSRIFFDKNGAAYLVSYQYNDPGQESKDLAVGNHIQIKPSFNTDYKNVLVTRFDAEGQMNWQRSFKAGTMHTGFFLQSVYVMTATGTEAKFYLIDAEGVVKSSKANLGDPDNYPNPMLYWPTGETTFVNIGHSPSKSGSFYINTVDMWAAEKKGKVEVEKKEKKKK